LPRLTLRASTRHETFEADHEAQALARFDALVADLSPEQRGNSVSDRQPDLYIEHPAIGIAGRIMFSLIFFLSGITHFTDLARYVALMPASTPFPAFWVMISGVVELAGSTMISTNRWPRLGAWLIAIFLVPVTITVHGYLLVNAPDEANRQAQRSFFLKGITMTGAALLFTQLGVRPDARR
jgi:putative oxidoreductase